MADYVIISTHSKRVVADTRAAGFPRGLSPTRACKEHDTRSGYPHRSHRRWKSEPAYGYEVRRIDDGQAPPFRIGDCGLMPAAVLAFVCWIGWD